jgi:hypothetical protein
MNVGRPFKVFTKFCENKLVHSHIVRILSQKYIIHYAYHGVKKELIRKDLEEYMP